MAKSPDEIVQFVRGVDLPDVGPRLEAVTGADEAAEVEIPGGQSVVAVGSQLAEFAPAVAAQVRPAIANNLLLAQLAANKAASQASDVFAWYNKYTATLQNLGWRLADSDFQAQVVRARDAKLHEEIIPIITAMLGPQVAAASLVVGVLKGLGNMNRGAPWITVFDRSSQHASGAKFQVSFVDVDEAGDPQIKALYFGVQAARSVTQVLFFRFSEQRAELRQASGSMSASGALLSATHAEIANRVQQFVSDFVRNVEI